MMLGIEAMACGMEQDQVADWQCVIYHKQRTSARTRFLCLGRDVVLPGPIAADARLGELRPQRRVLAHPAAGLAAVSAASGIAVADLRVEPEALAALAANSTRIWLVELMLTDPPEGAMGGARFVSIIEARGVAPVQRELLRLAYERILG